MYFNFSLVQFKENICLQIGFLCLFLLLSMLRSFYTRGGPRDQGFM